MDSLHQLEELKSRIINQKLQDRAEGEMGKKRAQDGLLLEKKRYELHPTLNEYPPCATTAKG
eukprot:635-Pyramimonas_sp.AAC.2